MLPVSTRTRATEAKAEEEEDVEPHSSADMSLEKTAHSMLTRQHLGWQRVPSDAVTRPMQGDTRVLVLSRTAGEA